MKLDKYGFDTYFLSNGFYYINGKWKNRGIGYDTERKIEIEHLDTKMYKKRLQLKQDGSPLQLPIKLILNSIYGKTAQRVGNRMGKVLERHIIHERETRKSNHFMVYFEEIYRSARIWWKISFPNVPEPEPF